MNSGPQPIVAVVLAAGAGRRFHGPTHKLDALLDPTGRDARTVLRRAVDAALDSAIGPVIVVRGAPITTTLPSTVDVVDNPDWAAGQLTSLCCGLAAAARRNAWAAVVGLGDQPLVTPASWRAVAAAPREIPIAVATYATDDGGTRRGNPVRLRADIWPMLAPDPDPAHAATVHDHGARELMHVHPELVREIPCPGPVCARDADIDTLEDLARWQSNSSTSSP